MHNKGKTWLADVVRAICNRKEDYSNHNQDGKNNRECMDRLHLQMVSSENEVVVESMEETYAHDWL